ncbi:MAG: type II toxin-antitoxin system VapC family toxin [Ilumatobacteraceae bacterium]
MTVVVDASVVVDALVDRGVRGDRARDRLVGERLVGPELIDVEVVATLRRMVTGGVIDVAAATVAIADYADIGVRRFGHRRLLPRAWELRQTVSAYDAIYVALAERLGLTLVTADRRLAGAPGIRCEVEVLTR